MFARSGRVVIPRWQALGSLGCAVALVAACSGASPTTTPTTAAAASVAARPDKPFKIGAIGEFTGNSAVFGQVTRNAMELAIADINNAGGVWGMPVQAEFIDSQGDPQQAVTAAQQLVNVSGANVLIEFGSSSACLSVKESVAVPNQILEIGTGCISPAHTADQSGRTGFFFRIRPPLAGLIQPMALVMSEDGVKNVCAMYVDNAYGQAANTKFIESFGGYAPDGDVTSQPIPFTPATTYLSEIQTCTADGHDTVATLTYGQGQADIYMEEAVENQLATTYYFVEDQEDPAIFNRLGWATFDGMKGFSGAALPSANYDLFLSEYAAKFGGPPGIPLTEMGYDAVMVAALAAEKANSAVSADIRDQVFEIGNPPGEPIGPGTAAFKTAIQMIAAGQKINYVGVVSRNGFADNGEELSAGTKLWHVDGPTSSIVVDGVFQYDQGTGEVTFTKAEGCKFCDY